MKLMWGVGLSFFLFQAPAPAEPSIALRSELRQTDRDSEIARSQANLIGLRDQTKGLLQSRHCYNCHSPQGRRPLAGAMKVYNLSKEDWFSTMSDRQLKEFQRRMLTHLNPDELNEMGGDPNETPLLPREARIVSDWVEAELASRHPNSLRQLLRQ